MAWRKRNNGTSLTYTPTFVPSIPTSSSSASSSTCNKIPPHCVSVKKASISPRGYKNFEEWSKVPEHLYIGRNMSFYVPGAQASKWRNPFAVKKYGLQKCLEMYEAHVRADRDLYNSLIELEGKEMGCWCKPSPCHGAVSYTHLTLPTICSV